MEVKLNEEDFKKIQPFFLEMRRVGDYDQYLTMSIGEIQRKLKDTPNDPTLKAIVEFLLLTLSNIGHNLRLFSFPKKMVVSS